MTQYERPRIADYGDLTTLTAAFTTGNEFDDNFNVNDPFQFDILSCDPTQVDPVTGNQLPCVHIGP